MTDGDKNSRTDRSSEPDKKPTALQKPEQLHPQQQNAEQEEAWTRREESSRAPDAVAGQQPREGQPDGLEQNDENIRSATKQAGFPIIGIGASAGGLEALKTFVAALPEKSGIAYVAIVHTHPDYTTMLPNLLRKKSKAAVVLLEDGMPLAPDTVYVPPSNRDATIENGIIRLQARASKTELHMPIDIFLRSLATDRGEAAGCIILSGTGSDGTGGVRRIKEEAGVVIAQSKVSARHPGMPGSAIDTGLIDYVLEPSEMPGRLIDYFRHPSVIRSKKSEEDPEILNRIIAFLDKQTRHDFSLYKKSTLVRRVERRMSVNRCLTISDYLHFLHRTPREAHALFQDLLIGVTNFFRDPEVFDFLKENVLPDLLFRTGSEDRFRVWMPGCATGEEAYSMAILLIECMEAVNIKRELQIFATDINPTAIEKARLGIYLKNIATDVSPERLERFFTPQGNHFRVKKELREPVIFAEQNILRDPPFMNLNLLVCRNLLIYLESAAQAKAIPLFHYNLKPGGILFLGTSESTGHFAELFEPIHKKFGLYKKVDARNRLQSKFQFPSGRRRTDRFETARTERLPAVQDGIENAVERTLLDHHTPPCVVVDPIGNIVYIHGRTGKYLEHAPGKPSIRLVDTVREGLRPELAAALRQAGETRTAVRKPGLWVKTNGDFTHVDLTVKPLHSPSQPDRFMVLFEEVHYPEEEAGTGKKNLPGRNDPKTGADGKRVNELEVELDTLLHNYRSTFDALETSNEELKSANEEMHSSNEELQSTNEELESSREELESLNEELSMVNSELHNKIVEVEEAYSKITEVLNSTGVAIVFLDNDLMVRRFTLEATRLINLIEKDVGRPIEHISHNLAFDRLTETIRRTLRDLTPYEEEVVTRDGHWYRMRIIVHRTEKNTIEGVAMTFINIDAQKAAQAKLEEYSEKSKSLPTY